MMTWKRVDLPEPVLPAKSACWRVPLPMARYCSLVAPVRPMATRSSLRGVVASTFPRRLRRDLQRRGLRRGSSRRCLADLVHQRHGQFGIGRWVERQRRRPDPAACRGST